MKLGERNKNESKSSDLVHRKAQIASNIQTGRVGFGGILLSPEGQFQAACNGPLCCVQDPLVAEALACREVLLWLRRRGVREVELFSDCLTVVQLLCQECSKSQPGYLKPIPDSPRPK
ncbi:hypothetical protein DM860_018048 [Cuscuta australis]|uniref:RNase H type-1 domain-containing protein n=1 Tax=Cuscuta australis TaxID=267555 RepID=A0A328DV97_9ASTE|nr:hypothetical protein DM860_018048 [Cuscuta australis]